MGRKLHITAPPYSDSSIGLRIRQKMTRAMIHFLVWTGMAVVYYICFSFFFDTPVEYRMKHSTDILIDQYQLLSERYDSISMVLDNVAERDRNVFNTLFEAQPYDFDADFESWRSANYELLLLMTNKELGNLFFEKSKNVEKSVAELIATIDRLDGKIETTGRAAD
jgi:hypothetical protein